MARVVSKKMISTTENVDAFCRHHVEHFKSRYTSVDCFAIELLMREALLNAVVHGNHKDHSKKIFVECYFGVRKFRIRVTDAGQGFDWKKRLCKSNPFCKTSGRGLSILRQYATAVKFNKSGNSVTIERQLSRDSGG